MLFDSRSTGIPGLAPPQVLIFFSIPKTGSETMERIFEHCFQNQYFFFYEVTGLETALWVQSTMSIRKKFHQLPVEGQRAVRCLMGSHFTMDVDTLFDRPSKFFTILRQPVDRAISNFFYNQTRRDMFFYPLIKDMTLEQYLDSGIGLDHDNHHVRMLSGCPELDTPWNLDGRPIVAPPVERRHLEMAKRNIEERFIVAAPLEQFTALVWFLKRLYGWPMNQVLFQIRNQTPNRPKLGTVSEATRKRLEKSNQYDIELYEWGKARFAEQIKPLEPDFSHEVRRFAALNNCAQRIGRLSPQPIRAMAKHLLFQTL